jgi:8-oxo-dGTP pyrophosphatase MutT (NUDIX family)
MVAASILPVTIHNHELYFLFGKENKMEDSAKGFSDFGGGVETGETIFETALREGSEEMCGFLGDSKQLARLIQKNGGTYKITFGSTDRAYHVHIFFMEYDENLPYYFTNHHRFLWERMDKTLLNNSKLFEKQEIKWFSLSALKKDTNEFRPFYREFVDLLLREVPKIKKFIVKRKSKKSKTMKIKKGG